MRKKISNAFRKVKGFVQSDLFHDRTKSRSKVKHKKKTFIPASNQEILFNSFRNKDMLEGF